MDSMSKKTQKRYWISSARQIKALTSPVRHQMHLVMEMLGPCSVRELASRMGREPATLYYHVKLLERVGIITKSGTRGAGRNEEIIYALAQEHVRVDMNQRSPKFVKALASGCGALLRYAERTFVAALRRDATIRVGAASELRIRQASVRLSKKSLIELNARLDELQDFIDASNSPSVESTYAITLCVAPVTSGD